MIITLVVGIYSHIFYENEISSGKIENKNYDLQLKHVSFYIKMLEYIVTTHIKD